MTKTKIIRVAFVLIYIKIIKCGEDGLDYWVRDPKFERRFLDPNLVSLPPNLNDSLKMAEKLIKKQYKPRSDHLISEFVLDESPDLPTQNNNDDNLDLFDFDETTQTLHSRLWVTRPSSVQTSTLKEISYKSFFDTEPRALYTRHHKSNKNREILNDIPGYNNPRYARRPPKNRDSRISHYHSKEYMYNNMRIWNSTMMNTKKNKNKSVFSGSKSRESGERTKSKSRNKIKRYKKRKGKSSKSTTTMTPVYLQGKKITLGLLSGSEDVDVTDEDDSDDEKSKGKKLEQDTKLLRQPKHSYNNKPLRQKGSYKPIKKYKIPKSVAIDNKYKQLVEDVSDTLDPYNIHKHFTPEKLDCEFPEANFEVQVIGKTVSRNDILLLKITEKESDLARHFRADDKFAEESPQKKIIFIVHGLSAMGIHKLPVLSKVKDFYKLLRCYTRHLEEFDFYVIPNANPDGFQLASQSSSGRYGKEWNKNQSPQDICLGVAVDRNFDVAWNESKNVSACNQMYPGPYPFSEPESEAVRQVIHKYSSKLLAYIHVHAATYDPTEYKGDAILYPKGYTDVVSEDDRYIDLRGEVEEEMLNAGFKIVSFTVDTLHAWYKKVSGTSVDYASSIYGIPYSMEFVMQSYENHTENAFKEIWDRLIDVTFNHMHNRITRSTVGVFK